MDNVDELAALSRIIICIKEYRRLSADYHDLFNNEFLDEHLKKCLIAADYVFWHFLRADERAKHNPPAPDSTDQSSLSAFKLLLSQYKRSVYEKLYWHWDKPNDDWAKRGWWHTMSPPPFLPLGKLYYFEGCCIRDLMLREYSQKWPTVRQWLLF